MNIVTAGAGRTIPMGPSAQFIVKEDGSLTRGNMVVAEMVIEPEFVAPPQHLHRAHEESWYILEGELEFSSGTRVRRVGPGGWVLVPVGIPHSFSNPGHEPTRFLAIMTPNLYLGYFEELGEAMTRAQQEGGELTDEMRSRVIAELMGKYQTEIVDRTAGEPGR